MADELWSTRKDECELFEEQDDAIGQELYGRVDYPETLTLYRWQRCKIPDRFLQNEADSWARIVLDEFDNEELIGCSEVSTKATEQDVADMLIALRAIASRYKVWHCERDGHTETVNVRDWVRENMTEDDDAMAWANGGSDE